MGKRPGKYAHITPKLPKLSLVEPYRRDIVNAVKDEILATTEHDEATEQSKILRLITRADGDVKEVLNLMKRTAGGKRHASKFAHAYAQVRVLEDGIKDWLSSLNVLLDAYTELMIEQMDVESVDAISMSDGASVGVHYEPYPQVKDKEAYRRWCVKNGFEKDLQMWPAKTTSLLKEMLLKGEAPADGIDAYQRPTVRLNKA